MITQSDLDNWFVYHAPQPGDGYKYTAIREAAKVFAQLVLSLTPASADQTTAIRKIREAVFTANAAIACERTP
jgi:hypothetical protein